MAAPPAMFVHDFALAAMQGILSDEENFDRITLKAKIADIDLPTALALASYTIAEAMMAESASH